MRQSHAFRLAHLLPKYKPTPYIPTPKGGGFTALFRLKRWYTGKEYYEKFRRENPGLDLRQRPPDNATVDENGNEPNAEGSCLIIWLIMVIALIAFLVFTRGG